MIARLSVVALLAVVAVAAPADDCGPEPAVGMRTASVAVAAAPVALKEYQGAVKKVVAKGKYAVALKNCGPPPERQIPVHTSRYSAPVQERPTVRLPYNVPAPKIVSHSCTCYKTIVRPRIHQHILTVPTVQRFIQTTHRPVVEHIEYEAIPVNCNEACNAEDKCDFVEVPVDEPAIGERIALPAQPVAVESSAAEMPNLPVFVVPAQQTVEVAQAAPVVQSVPIVQAAPAYQTAQSYEAFPAQSLGVVAQTSQIANTGKSSSCFSDFC